MRLVLNLPEEEGKKKVKKRNNRGFLTIRADKIKKTEDIIKFQIHANLKSKKFLGCFGSDAPYLLIERARQNLNYDDNQQEEKSKKQDMVSVLMTSI